MDVIAVNVQFQISIPLSHYVAMSNSLIPPSSTPIRQYSHMYKSTSLVVVHIQSLVLVVSQLLQTFKSYIKLIPIASASPSPPLTCSGSEAGRRHNHLPSLLWDERNKSLRLDNPNLSLNRPHPNTPHPRQLPLVRHRLEQLRVHHWYFDGRAAAGRDGVDFDCCYGRDLVWVGGEGGGGGGDLDLSLFEFDGGGFFRL